MLKMDDMSQRYDSCEMTACSFHVISSVSHHIIGDPPESGITPTPTAAYVRGQATAKETGQIRADLGIQQGKGEDILM